MKITDTLGRTLNIDVVVKAPGSDDWMQPLGYKLEDGKNFLRVPHGPFALRVMSRLGIDILVHVDGKRLLASSVDKGLQYVEVDDKGNPFNFGAPSGASGLQLHRARLDYLEYEEPVEKAVSSGDDENDGAVAPDQSEDATTGDANLAGGRESDLPVQMHLEAPAGAGLVFVVARFKDDPSIVGNQPPKQEFVLSFQLQAPGDHEKRLAGSLSKIVEPPAPPDPDDLVSMNPSSNRPAFTCSATGHSH